MAWICQNCDTSIDDDAFEICWNCSSEKGATKALTPKSANRDCLRCQTSLTFIGTKEFHEGVKWGVLGNLAELFVNKEHLDMFACKACGKVEFFLSGFNESI